MQAWKKWGLGVAGGLVGLVIAGGVLNAVTPLPPAGERAAAPSTVAAPTAVAVAPSEPSEAPMAVAEPVVTPASAADVVAELGSLFPVPNPRDTSEGCREFGCVQRITTNAVTVTQMETDQAARDLAAQFVAQDGRHAGRFVLTFVDGGTSSQRFTSDEARDAFEVRARELSGS